ATVHLRGPARTAPSGGRVPRGRALGPPRRRLQSPRARGEPPCGVRAVLQRPVQDAVGSRRELRRRGESWSQTSCRREWARMGERVPHRRLPPRRHPRDSRREPGAHPDRVRRGRPRGGGAGAAARPRDRRVPRQRPSSRARARRGWPGTGRDLVRRLPPRASPPTHRRDRGLLRGLHGRSPPAERVRRGRLEEFSRFGWQGTIADPNAPATFVASRLNHALGGAPRHRALREYYRRWLTLRRTHAALGAHDKDLTRVALDDAVLT